MGLLGQIPPKRGGVLPPFNRRVVFGGSLGSLGGY
jgi:hypothetical protein